MAMIENETHTCQGSCPTHGKVPAAREIPKIKIPLRDYRRSPRLCRPEAVSLPRARSECDMRSRCYIYCMSVVGIAYGARKRYEPHETCPPRETHDAEVTPSEPSSDGRAMGCSRARRAGSPPATTHPGSPPCYRMRRRPRRSTSASCSRARPDGAARFLPPGPRVEPSPSRTPPHLRRGQRSQDMGRASRHLWTCFPRTSPGVHSGRENRRRSLLPCVHGPPPRSSG